MTDELLTTEKVAQGDGLIPEGTPIVTPAVEQPLDYPETPATAPTHDYHVANKKYVDDSVPSVPVKATGAEINTGTNDTKFATPKAIADSDVSFELSYSSATLRFSSDTAERIANPGAWFKAREITVTTAGKIRTMFDLEKYTYDPAKATKLIAGKIYVNGVAEGTEHQTDNQLDPDPPYGDNYETFTDDGIDVEVGDLVQLYVKDIDSSINDFYIRNFRLYWDLSTREYIDAGDVQPETYLEYLAGPLTGFAHDAGTGDTNHDETCTTNFTPSFIKLTYYMQGDAGGGNGVDHQFAKTIFQGTTPIMTHISAQKTSAGSDNVVPTTIVKVFQTTPATCGVNSSNGIKTTLTILSTSSTNFVVRVAVDESDGSPAGTARFYGYWEAWQ